MIGQASDVRNSRLRLDVGSVVGESYDISETDSRSIVHKSPDETRSIEEEGADHEEERSPLVVCNGVDFSFFVRRWDLLIERGPKRTFCPT